MFFICRDSSLRHSR